MTDQVYKTDALIAHDIDAYLELHQNKTLLRFITCGSVDDGKSTLIGRLLYDSKMIFEDQLTQLESDSKRIGTQGQDIDFALLVDGLAAEREQGITIDVAYRFFATEKRKFIVADTPGHEQYTRNMVTGASTAELAVILIDARKGILTQTRRHSYLAHLLGIKNIVLAVNKMDLVDYDEARFNEIVDDYRAFAETIGIQAFTAIPLSGLAGDNITIPSLGSATTEIGGKTIERNLLSAIIRPRVEEILEILQNRMAKARMEHTAGSRFVLTGGASQLTGLADLFARQSKKSIGIGTPIGVAGLDENNSSSGYAASIGGLIHVSRLEDNDPDDRQTRTLPHGPFERIGAWFRDNL